MLTKEFLSKRLSCICIYCHSYAEWKCVFPSFRKWLIRELVDSLCRDDADTPIIHGHWKAFISCKLSCSKPCWAPIYLNPAFLYPVIPSQAAHVHPLTYCQKTAKPSSSSETSKLDVVVTVVLLQIHCKQYQV